MAAIFDVKLVDDRMVGPQTRHLVFERTDGAVLSFTPGQFIQFHFEQDNQLIKRSYSIANTQDADETHAALIEVAVSYVEGGVATEIFKALKIGDELSASGPYGRFCLQDDENARYIFVGTGTGITPYRSMMNQVKEKMREGTRFVMLFGARTPDELIYGDEFDDLHNEAEFFDYFPCLSREMRAEAIAEDREGYVQHRFEELELNPDQDIVYLCGNPDMVDEAFKQLQDKGFASNRIRREKYVSPKR